MTMVTVSKAAVTDASRRDQRLVPKTLNASAISHTFNGGLEL